MTAGLQRAFDSQVIRSGTRSRTYTTVKCSKCPKDFTYESASKLPDQVLTKKIQQFGWLLSKDRNHDICPGCLGVRPENRLAARFKVSLDGGAVPTPGECAAQAGRSRDARHAQTAELIARHFPAKPAAEPQAPPPPEPVPAAQATPSTAADPSLNILLDEMRQLRAASELQLEISQQIADHNKALLEQNRALTEQGQIALRMNGQLIEAIGRMAGMTGRQNEAMLTGIGQVTSALRHLGDIAREHTRPKPAWEELPRAKSLAISGPRRETPFSRRLDANLSGSRPKPPPVDEETRERLAREREQRVLERRASRTLIAAE